MRTRVSCDYDHQTLLEVRRLPIGGGSGILVCSYHFPQAVADWTDKPEWESLPLSYEYEQEEEQPCQL